MAVRVQTADFDVAQEIAALRAHDPRVGAVVTFIGTVRDVNEDAHVLQMTLEHYPGMTEKALDAIVAQAREHPSWTRRRASRSTGERRPRAPIVWTRGATCAKSEPQRSAFRRSPADATARLSQRCWANGDLILRRGLPAG